MHVTTLPWFRYVSVSSLSFVAGDVAAFNTYWNPGSIFSCLKTGRANSASLQDKEYQMKQSLAHYGSNQPSFQQFT